MIERIADGGGEDQVVTERKRSNGPMQDHLLETGETGIAVLHHTNVQTTSRHTVPNSQVSPRSTLRVQFTPVIDDCLDV